jgi:uncharacterized membrane protein (DUF106 family)
VKSPDETDEMLEAREKARKRDEKRRKRDEDERNEISRINNELMMTYIRSL